MDGRKLINDIINDPDCINSISEEDLLTAQKAINPYGQIIAADKSWINVSIINWRDKFIKELMMTAMIGYVYRCLDEYEPHKEYHQVWKKRREELNNDEILKTEISAANKLEHTVVKRFLDKHFEYNPDVHLKQAPRENEKDPERTPLREAMRNNKDSSVSAPFIRQDLGRDPKENETGMADKLLTLYQSVKEATRLIKNSIEKVSEDNKVALVKINDSLSSMCAFLEHIAVPISAEEIQAVYKTLPPTDAFFNLDRYIVNHYEQLREAHSALYCSKPDLEYAIAYYGSFTSEEEARNHRRKYESTVISNIYTIENQGWTILGPFKQNRDKLDFYNKHTEVLKQMFDQVEEDHKTGAELMKRRVKREKHKNIIEAGIDDPGLAKYKAACSTIEAYGAQKILSEEDKKKLRDATLVKEQTEVPSNAVQVDTFYTNDKGELVRTKWYTESEEPANPNVITEEQKREHNKLMNLHKSSINPSDFNLAKPK